MDFRPFAGFPNGWQLGWQSSPSLHLLYPERPYFRLPDGTVKTPEAVAAMPEGRAMFHHVKKWLDFADQRYGNAAQEQPDWRAADKAKMAMHVTLDELGAMSDDLLDNEVMPGPGRIG